MADCATEPTLIATKSILKSGSPANITTTCEVPLGQLVGCLLYLACWTRPDIAAAALFWYFKPLPPSSPTDLAYSDATWVTCLDTRRSTTSNDILLASPTLLRSNNQSSLAMAHASSSHHYTRHVDIKYHYIRELVNNNITSLSYVTMHNMLADIFTKGRSRNLHKQFMQAMGLGAVH
ncbi:hypothetical protein JCM1840_000194 [Sporobolomyces johnsonii]